MKIQLPNVTLVITSSVRIPEHIDAINISRKNIDFGETIFLSHEEPETLPEKTKFVYYPSMNDIMAYNNLIFKEIGQFINTSHALFIQDHAYVIYPEVWNNEWLEYDYIGAPWPIRQNSYIADTGERVRVGNGGFSLRSKKLMDLPKILGLQLTQEQGFYNEDGNTTCYHRSRFLENGINYAPVEVAAHFSYETAVEENKNILKTFGFHKFRPDQNNPNRVINLGV